MERVRGHGVGNVLDSRRCVGNGLDRERVNVVIDDRATRTKTGNCHDHGNAKIVLGVAVVHEPAIAIKKWAMALGCQQGTRPCQTPGTIQYIINTSAAVRTVHLGAQYISSYYTIIVFNRLVS